MLSLHSGRKDRIRCVQHLITNFHRFIAIAELYQSGIHFLHFVSSDTIRWGGFASGSDVCPTKNEKVFLCSEGASV